jgi:hypothetical protein
MEAMAAGWIQGATARRSPRRRFPLARFCIRRRCKAHVLTLYPTAFHRLLPADESLLTGDAARKYGSKQQMDALQSGKPGSGVVLPLH